METNGYYEPEPLEHNPNSVRLVALREIDSVGFSRFHLKAILVAGAGFFTDAYNIFVTTIACLMIELVYDGGVDSATLDRIDLGIKIATPLGNLVGQLYFGWLADRLGRKRMYGWELVIIICSTFAQAIAGQGPSISITSSLIIWRFCMGIGIGGDCPLSAIITSEFAPIHIRGRMMTAVFAMQGFGYLTAAVIAAIVTAAWQGEITPSGEYSSGVDSCWRLLIGFGCVPGVLALYVRLTIPETPRWTMDVKYNVEKGVRDVDRFLMKPKKPARNKMSVAVDAQHAPNDHADFIAYFSQWKNGKVLLGTAYSWFATDVAFYGLSFNSSIVLYSLFSGIPLANNSEAYPRLYDASIANLILSLCGLIPGYWVCFLVIDKWGRKPIQYMGFAVLTVIFVCMSSAFTALQISPSGPSSDPTSSPSHPTMQAPFVFLWCLANFFLNFGPNTTTFIIPGETFPTRYRATAHGVSAASGKLGSIISQLLVWKLGGRTESYRVLLGIFAIFMFTGLFSTMLLPETNNQTLETLSNELPVFRTEAPSSEMLPLPQDAYVRGERLRRRPSS